MPISRLSLLSATVVIALIAVALVISTLTAAADGPIIDTQSSNDAIAIMFGQKADALTGHAIASGDVNGDGYEDLIVGAPFADIEPYTHTYSSGGVYLYLGRPDISRTIDLVNQPVNVTFYVTSSIWSREELGRSVAIGDLNGDGLDDIIVGASHYGASPIGSTIVWMGRDTITTSTAISINLYADDGSGFNIKAIAAWVADAGGWDVASGDINGDNIDDLIMGSPFASVDPVTDTSWFPPDYQRYHSSSLAITRTFNGAAYVLLGTSTIHSASNEIRDFLPCLPELTLYGQRDGDYFGRSVATGDVNGDGIDDVIIGAPGFNPNGGTTDGGAVYVFYGSTVITHAVCNPYVEPYTFANQIVKDLDQVTADVTLTGIAVDAFSGFDVNVGRVNSDAYADIIIGAPGIDGNRGQVYVVYGAPNLSNTLPLSQAEVTISGDVENAWLGTSVLARDLNRDTVDDLVLGAIGIDPSVVDEDSGASTTDTGTAYVLFGGNLSPTIVLTPTGTAADLKIIGASADDWLGRGLGAGDLNGDGYDELLIGAAGLDHTSMLTDAGSVYIFNLVYPQQITVTASPAQVPLGDAISLTAIAQTWIGARDFTTQTTFTVSPGAGGILNGRVYTTEQIGAWVVTATIGNVSGTTTITVTDQPITGLSASNSSPTTVGSPTYFTATVSGGSNVTYAWSFGDGGTASGATAGHTYSAAGNYTAAVTATNSASQIVATTPVTVTNTAPIANAGSDQSVFVDALVTLNGSGSSDPDGHPITAHGWTQTGGPSVSLSSATVVSPTFTAPGAPSVLTFRLIVTDAFGLASAPDTVVITTTDRPITGLSAGSSSPTAVGNPTYFTATVSGGSNVTYTWSFGDGGTASGATASHTYSAGGNYTAAVTAANSVSQIVVTTPVTVSWIIHLPLIMQSSH